MTVASDILICLIAVIAIAGVIIRPFALPEALWPLIGAALLVLLRLLQPSDR